MSGLLKHRISFVLASCPFNSFFQLCSVRASEPRRTLILEETRSIMFACFTSLLSVTAWNVTFFNSEATGNLHGRVTSASDSQSSGPGLSSNPV